jgi:hypothetical protein
LYHSLGGVFDSALPRHSQQFRLFEIILLAVNPDLMPVGPASPAF